MAQRTVVTFVSDLTGKPIGTDNATLQFGLEGSTYEIDLSAKEQKALRDVLAPYIEAGRKVGSTRRRSSAKSQSQAASPKEIRAWAIENGHDIPARGRIPAAAAEAYLAAHQAFVDST